LKQLLQYGAVILNSWIITIIVVQVCLSTFTSNVLVAKLFAIPAATMCNFLLMQFVVFRAHRSEPEEENFNIHPLLASQSNSASH
jgi:putative flippase GtrA